MSFRRSLSNLVLVLLLATTFGCVNKTLKIEDRGQFTPSGRISYEFLPGIDQRRQGSLLDLLTGAGLERSSGEAAPSPRRKAQGTISLEGSIAYTEGRNHQNVEVGDQIKLDVIVNGPARVKLTARNTRAHIAARGGARFFDIITLEAILGVTLDSTEFRLRTAGTDTRDRDIDGGLLFGGRLSVRPIPLFDLYFQYTISLMQSVVRDIEIGTELNLTRNLSAYAGYRWWDYYKNREGLNSNRRLEIDGPTAGISLKF